MRRGTRSVGFGLSAAGIEALTYADLAADRDRLLNLKSAGYLDELLASERRSARPDEIVWQSFDGAKERVKSQSDRLFRGCCGLRSVDHRRAVECRDRSLGGPYCGFACVASGISEVSASIGPCLAGLKCGSASWVLLA